MTEHLCRQLNPQCFRCELNADENAYPPHDCDTGDLDRVVCPSPCETMHTYCSVCGAGPAERCYLSD